MALFTTFGELLVQTRVEARQSPNPAVGSDANTRYKALVNRVYESLYDNYDWPHLKVLPAPRVQMAAGQRYYDFPAALAHHRIERVNVWWSGICEPLGAGIGSDQYNSFDSEADERSDPPQRWRLGSTSIGVVQFEVWPMPATAEAEVEFVGLRKLSKLVNSSDICLLDDSLVSRFAAAEILRPISKEDADSRLAAARERLAQLRARSVLPATDTSAPSMGVTGNARLEGGRVVLRVS